MKCRFSGPVVTQVQKNIPFGPGLKDTTICSRLVSFSVYFTISGFIPINGIISQQQQYTHKMSSLIPIIFHGLFGIF